MKKVITLALLVIGVFLTIKGVETLQAATANAEFLGLEIQANDKSGQTAGLIYTLLGIAAFAASYFSWKK